MTHICALSPSIHRRPETVQRLHDIIWYNRQNSSQIRNTTHAVCIAAPALMSLLLRIIASCWRKTSQRCASPSGTVATVMATISVCRQTEGTTSASKRSRQMFIPQCTHASLGGHISLASVLRRGDRLDARKRLLFVPGHRSLCRRTFFSFPINSHVHDSWLCMQGSCSIGISFGAWAGVCLNAATIDLLNRLSSGARIFLNVFQVFNMRHLKWFRVSWEERVFMRCS